jgi:hypothetical protein
LDTSKITTRSELERVDENAHRYFTVVTRRFSCDSNQLEMTSVQRAHGRHEDSSLGVHPRQSDGICDALNSFHGRNDYDSATLCASQSNQQLQV